MRASNSCRINVRVSRTTSFVLCDGSIIIFHGNEKTSRHQRNNINLQTMILIATLFTILSLTASSVDARRRPLMNKEQYAGVGFQNETLSAALNCAEDSTAYSCELPSDQGDGAFVCRSWVTKLGLELRKVGCFPSNRELLGTDECGCCGKVCPTICNTCPCTTKRGRSGAYIVYEGSDEPVCRSTFIATKLVHRDEKISCLADCMFRQ